MTTVTTGLKYFSCNDVSYNNRSWGSDIITNGFTLGKQHTASISTPLIGLLHKGLPTNYSCKMFDPLGNTTYMQSFRILTYSQELAITILSLTLGTFTVLENLMVLCVILNSRTLRTRPSYHFIGSLAVADLIASVIFVYSFLEFHIFCRNDNKNVFLFKLAGVIASFTASVGSLFLTAIDRYISIHRPMAYKRIVTKTKAIAAFSLMWSISIFISLLPLLGWNCEKLKSICSDIFPLIDQKYLMFWLGVTSILVLFIFYAYMFILWKAHHHAVRMHSHNSQRSVTSDQSCMDLRLAKTLVLILVALIICWGPVLVIMVFDLLCMVNEVTKTAFAFCSMLCLLNSTVNPMIYAMRSKDLRRAFLNIFQMCRETAQPHNNSGVCDCYIRSVRNTSDVSEKERKVNMVKVSQVSVARTSEDSTTENV